VRSSSLDLNKLSKKICCYLTLTLHDASITNLICKYRALATSTGAQYQYQPRSSKGMIASGAEMPARSFLSPSHQGGAFSVYRKPQAPSTATIHEPTSMTAYSNMGQVPGIDPLREEIGNLRQENRALSTASSFLLEQLSELQTGNRVLSYKIRKLNNSVEPSS